MFRLLAFAAFVATGTAQPDAECTNELMALVRSAASVNDATCEALAAFEGCVSRVGDRAVQNGLEIELSAKQERLQGCRAAPMTAAIRTERDALDVDGREIRFHRTIRQTINVHTLNEEVGHNADNITSMQDEISGMSDQISTSESAMQSRMEASAADLRGDVSTAQSQLADAMAALTTATANTVSTSVAAMNARITTQLAAAAATAAATTRALNTSVQLAITAANNAAVPHVYVQWGARACTAASGASVVKLYDGMMYGSRHQYSGGSPNQFCLKNAAGDQGGVRQGGHDSNDLMVPVRKEHSNYNSMPSLGNQWRQRDGYNIPCAKCKYAKSCFMEVGVAVCPSGYFKMYTGYLHGQHISHSGGQNRICLDKNPASGDYRNNGQWDAHLYATIAKDGTGAGPRNNHVVPACHMCCAR
jgi:hypothetical protein